MPTITASYKRPSAMPHFMRIAGAFGNVKIGQCVTVVRDDDSRTASPDRRRQKSQRPRLLARIDDGHAVGFGLQDRTAVVRRRPTGHRAEARQQKQRSDCRILISKSWLRTNRARPPRPCRRRNRRSTSGDSRPKCPAPAGGARPCRKDRPRRACDRLPRISKCTLPPGRQPVVDADNRLE